MNKVFDAVMWVAITLLVLGVIGFVVYLHWSAYFQRFPNAAWWSFFFS